MRLTVDQHVKTFRLLGRKAAQAIDPALRGRRHLWTIGLVYDAASAPVSFVFL